MTPFNIITGFLGSGKTTLLKNLLMLSPQKRIAVIQNEFAPTGVDGKELKQVSPNLKLLEINNGSVFCVCQFSNFVETLKQLHNSYHPEEIYLETSGLADPISVAELLSGEDISKYVHLNLIITVLDAVNYFKGLNVLQRFKHQIMVADVLLINKSDVASENVFRISEHAKLLNPYAAVYKASFAEIDETFFSASPIGARNQFSDLNGGGKPEELTACVLRMHNKVHANQLNELMADLQQFCVRIKGFLQLSDGNWVNIHSVYDQISILPISNYTGASELIAFGSQLTMKTLRQHVLAFSQ